MGYSPFQRGAPPERETQMEETILTAQNLKFRYDSDQPVYALDGVSTEVKRGEFVAVLGANGCGKSTLAKHMNAILLPSGGTVYVNGVDTRRDEEWLEVRRTVGMVFQNPDNQIVSNVVEEDVAFAPENLGVPTDEIRRRVDKALEIASTIAKNAPLSLKFTKQIVHAASQMSEEDAMRYCDAAYRFIEKTEDGIEGPAAFVEKRTPNWQGK